MPEPLKTSPITNPGFKKYRTFPDNWDAETEMLKLEWWLCMIWDGKNPVDYWEWG